MGIKFIWICGLIVGLCLFDLAVIPVAADDDQFTSDIQLKVPKSAPLWHANFSEDTVTIHMNSEKNLTIELTNLESIGSLKDVHFELHSDKPHLASILNNHIIKPTDGSKIWQQNFTISGNFLGNPIIDCVLYNSKNTIIERSVESLNLIVIREARAIDHIFTGSVVLLVSLLYINFGAALDLTAMKGIFMCPIGPIIGFFGQFIVMPLLSYGLGYLLFPDMVELHLGLFFTGVSPGGGASNIWTVILQGNINLSIIMTSISTFAAFGMMPFWIFTLGKVIFDRGNLGVPYQRIAFFAIGLIVPLFIGLGIQKFCPRISRILVRLLKPISILLILFIVIFAIVTNLYLFELFSWKIVLAGLGLPLFGYTISWCIAKLMKQPTPDAIAIAIETGIQNTGIAIFLLRFSLDQPQADLTTVIPVSVAIMTPIPLFIFYLWQKCRNRFCSNNNNETQSIIRSDIS